MTPQRGFDRLTPLEEARERLFLHCQLVQSSAKRVELAIGFIAAETIVAPAPTPEQTIALRDGFAVTASETVGASPYAPAFALKAPHWITSGTALPPSADAVLSAHAIQENSLPVEILAQASPGEGLRWPGGDFKAGSVVIQAGETVRPIHLALLRAAKIDAVAVRSPRLAILLRDDPPGGDLIGASFVAMAKVLGAVADIIPTRMHDTAAFNRTLSSIDADLILSLGGTGFGEDDHAAAALAESGSLLVHGLALHPGDTAGCGLLRKPTGEVPIILAPGRLESAFAIWLCLVRPCLRQMTGVTAGADAILPLARKITSNPGVSDIVLLRQTRIEDRLHWEPLAAGDLPWHVLAQATAWLVVPPESEGYASGTLLRAEEI